MKFQIFAENDALEFTPYPDEPSTNKIPAILGSVFGILVVFMVAIAVARYLAKRKKNIAYHQEDL